MIDSSETVRHTVCVGTIRCTSVISLRWVMHRTQVDSSILVLGILPSAEHCYHAPLGTHKVHHVWRLFTTQVCCYSGSAFILLIAWVVVMLCHKHKETLVRSYNCLKMAANNECLHIEFFHWRFLLLMDNFE